MLKMSFFKKLGLVLAICIMALPLVFGILFMDVTQAHDAEDFIFLFEKEYPKDQLITPAEQRNNAIRAYIIDCCKLEKDALQLLKDNGFEITRTIDPIKVAEFNSHYRQSKEHWASKYPEYVVEDYDTFISAKKTAGRWENLLHVAAEYQVNFFVKNQSVSWVTARIDQTMP